MNRPIGSQLAAHLKKTLSRVARQIRDSASASPGNQTQPKSPRARKGKMDAARSARPPPAIPTAESTRFGLTVVTPRGRPASDGPPGRRLEVSAAALSSAIACEGRGWSVLPVAFTQSAVRW